MIVTCQKCGAKNRLPDVDTQKTYRCYRCKATLGAAGGDGSGDSKQTAARSEARPERQGPNPLSVSFVLLVLLVAALIGGTIWQTAAKVSVGSEDGLGIVMYPDERLREIAKTVDNVESAQAHMTELIELMKNTAAKMDGTGIAAPQVGVPERIIVVRVRTGPSVADSEYVEMVNPEIIAREGTSSAFDGCMSLPAGDWKTEVTRSEKVTVNYLTSDGRAETMVASGGVARAIQHEVDHLNGVLAIDYAKHDHFNAQLVVAVVIYLLVLAVAVVLYVRNRVMDRKRTS
jgi:peptide deformylase